MNKLILWLLGIVVALFILFIVAAVSISLFVDPNKFKPQIITAVDNATGRSLSLAGDLKWSFFPDLGIEVGQASLSNPSGYSEQNFASIDSAKISVAVLPLLTGRMQVKTIELSDLQLHLVRSAQNNNNWTFIPETSTQEQTVGNSNINKAQSVPVWPDIENLLIDNANIVFDDQTSHAHYEIQNVNFEGKDIALDEPFWIQLSFIANSNQPALNAKINLKAKILFNTLNRVFNLSQMDLNTDVTFNRDKQTPLHIDSEMQGSMILDLHQETANIKPSMEVNKILTAEGQINVSHLLSSPEFTGSLQIKPFDLSEFLKSLGMQVPKTANSNALSNASFNIQFNGNTDNLNIPSIALTLNQSALQGQWAIHHFAAPSISGGMTINQLELSDFINLNGARLPIANINMQADLNIGNINSAVATLNGQLNVNFKSMTLYGIDLNAMVNSMGQSLNNAGKGQGLGDIKGQLNVFDSNQKINPDNGKTTQFGSFVANGLIKNGVYTSQQITLNGPNLIVNGSGTFNFNQQTLNFLFNIGRPGQEWVLPYRISGNVNDLTQGVDQIILDHEIQKYIAEQIKQAVQNTVKGGMSDLLDQLKKSVNQ